MAFKKFGVLVLSCLLALSCFSIPVSAAEFPGENSTIMRATGRINYTVAAKTAIPINVTVYLNRGETVHYDCTYSPKSASVDFGFIAPDGRFYFQNNTDGSIDQSIEVTQAGEYTLAIRNNESYAVTVTGTVRY